MHNPIKRAWVPKRAPTPAAHAASVAPPSAVQPVATPQRGARFGDDMPEPDVEEKNSDSVWAAFDSVLSREAESK